MAGGPLLLALGACVLAGLVSFASPCVVPLVPGYVSYLAGLVGSQQPRGAGSRVRDSGEAAVREIGASRYRVAGAAGLFVAGFTVVFVLASAAVFGLIGVLQLDQGLLERLGGVVTVVMGLAFVGLIPALQRDTRPSPRHYAGILGAPVLGAVFALGWTPCLGPTLSGVMAVAAGTEGMTAVRGVVLIIAYCLGLGLPFVLVALGSARAVRAVGWLRRNSRILQVVGGMLLVAVGVALITGVWDDFVGWVRGSFVSDMTLPI